VNMLHMPYLPFPDSFPQYLPKDKIANWLEFYVDAMDINYWGQTEFLGADFDDKSRTWNARIRRADGSERTLHPKHVIMATGGSGGTPKIPDLPGIDAFKGDLMHSAAFTGSAKYVGKQTLVVGVGTSAHDIALDLHQAGAEVTMLQRNPTTVVRLDTANAAYMNYADGSEHWKESDIKAAAAFQYPLVAALFERYNDWALDEDKELHQRLIAVGFEVDTEHRTGWLMKYFTRGGGYYIDVGASDVIASGGIKVLQSRDVESFVAEGAQLKDGSTKFFDAIVLATGFESQSVEVERYFGREVADRVGTIGGFDHQGEINVSWRPTGQAHLWIMIGSFQLCRMYAPLMALRIRAELDGLVTGLAQVPNAASRETAGTV
jgi:cation diffusion facilitator CzcD-associated flavoprotein CzcO